MCPSPNVSSLIGNQSVVSVGFLMDDVQSLLNYSTMAITPDPYFQPFTDTYELKTEYLILEVGDKGIVVFQIQSVNPLMPM